VSDAVLPNTLSAPADQLERDTLAAVLVEFETDDQLLAAAERTRAAGYRKFDAHSPYPIHGMDRAMGIRMTKLPWIVFGLGIAGALTGLALQYWTNSAYWADAVTADNSTPWWTFLPTYLEPYTYRVSGKPFFSLPAFIPIIFELTILLAAFGAVFGMLALNNLPWFYNALFTSKRFLRATSDRFFISIPANDPQFDQARTTEFAESLGGTVEQVYEVKTPGMPKPIFWAAWIIAALMLLPPVFVAQGRVDRQSQPRIHPIQDMDNQPRYKAQQAMPLFADGRAMRPEVAGTVARQDPLPNPPLLQGGRLVRNEESGQLQMEWYDGFPPEIPVDMALLERGREQYEVFCATCHGYDGQGNGMINQRAIDLQIGWVPAQTLVGDLVRERPNGHIYNTIKNGLNNMAGYGDQIAVTDRWAIVAYVRALQRSFSGSLDEVPPEKRANLR
jgi:mono/diheme cytochrome c family protein